MKNKYFPQKMYSAAIRTMLMTIMLAASSVFNNLSAQVVITTVPVLFDTATCKFPTPYVTLGDIVITETLKTDFAATAGIFKTLKLTAPANFSFLTGFPPAGSSITGNSADITGLSITSVSSSVITISFKVVAVGVFDVVTISGIKVRGTTSPTGGPNNKLLRLANIPGGTAVINGDLGGAGVVHATFTSVARDPTISVQPSNSTPPPICVGGIKSFSVSTFAGPISYQWQVDTAGVFYNLANGGTYGGVTTALVNIYSAPASMSGYQYRCIITGTQDVCTSDTALLTVNSPPAITVDPNDTTVCQGSSASFSVTATGSSLTYAWLRSTDGGSTFNSFAIVAPYSLNGAFPNFLFITATPASFNTYQYHCVVGGDCGPNVQSTTPGILTVNAKPTTAAAGPDQTGSSTCGLTSVTLAGNKALSGTGNWSIISGDGLGSLAVPTDSATTFSGTAGITYVLRWTISNGVCTPSTDDVSIKFNIAPTTSLAGPDQTSAATCGLTSVTLAANAPANGTGNWSVSSGTGGTFSLLSDPAALFSGTAGNTYVLRWTISNAPCTASVDSVTIKFNLAPTPAAAGPDQTGVATCGLTSVSLAGNAPSTGTGSWSVFSGGGGGFVLASNPFTVFSGTAGNTYVLVWTTLNAPCVSTDSVTIKFNQNPTTAYAGPDQISIATCGLTSVNLSATPAAIGTGNWSIISGDGLGSLTDTLNPGTPFSGTVGITYVLRWTISFGICSPSSDDVTIKFNQAPTPANAGPNQTSAATCGLTSVTLAANTPTIGTGSWSVFSGTGGSFSLASDPLAVFSGITGNTYVLRWTILNAPCPASFSSVTITLNEAPTVAAAGPDQTDAATCGLTSVTLAALPVSIGTGSWSVFSGAGGSFVLVSDPTTVFNGIAGSAYVLVWTTSNGPCVSTDTVAIKFNQAATVATAGSDQTSAATCGLTSVPLTANAPGAGTSSWSILSGAGGSFTLASDPAAVFSGTTGTAYVLRWTITDVLCVSTDDVNITFNQVPDVAAAGPDQISPATCGLTSVTLAANQPGVGIGSWSIISGAGGSFALASNPFSIFNGTAGTTYVLRWTITNAPCVSSDDVTITFNQSPTIAAAGPDQTSSATCGLSSVTLAANAPVFGTGSWSVFSGVGGTFVLASDSASVFNGIPGNTYTLRWTISNAPCTASTSDVTIKFNLAPTPADAGLDQTGAATCGLTSVTLAANTPVTGAGSWSIFSGAGGSFTLPTSPVSVFNGTAGSTYVLVWTILNESCISTDSAAITFNEFPTTAAAGPDQTSIATCGLTSVTLAANTPDVGTAAWSVFSGTGGSFTLASDPAAVFSGTAGTTYVLVWTITTMCSSSTDSVTVRFNPKPTVSTHDPSPVCFPAVVDLTLPAVTAGSTGGLNFSYFTNPGATTHIADSSNIVLSGTYYIVGTTALGCTDTNSVYVSVDAIAVGGSVGSDAFVCPGANGDTLRLTGSSGAIQKWQYSVDGGSNWNDIANTTTKYYYSNITATTWYRVLLTAFCANAISIEGRITVDTSPLPVGGTVSANDTVCSTSNTNTLTLTGFFGHITRWEYSIDGGAVWVYINDTTSSLIYNNLTSTTIYHAIVQNSSCGFAVSSNDTITVSPPSIAGTISGAVSGCAFANGGTLILSGNSGAVVKWQYSVNAGAAWIDSANTTSTQVYSNLTDTIFYRVIVKSGVCLNDTSAASAVIIYPKPVAAFTADTVCFGGVTTFTNASAIGSGFVQFNQWTFGDNNSSVSINPTHIYGLPGVKTVSLITTSNLGCLDTAVVNVLVNALPDAQIISSGALSFCCGGSVTLTAQAGLNYLWSTFAATQSITISNCLSSGLYVLTVKDLSTLCTNSSSVSVVIFPLPVAKAGNDTTISLGSSYILHGQGGASYLWSPAAGLSNPNIFDPLASPLLTTTFELTVADINGCSDTDSLTITVNTDYNLTIQSLMTVNGDGYNDRWIVKNIENYPGTEAIIINREGQQVFYSSSYDNSWNGLNNNGKPLPDGTYYYFLKFRNSNKLYKGPLTILNEK